MNIDKLKNAYYKAYKAYYKADSLVKAIPRYVKFEGFSEDDKPQISMCGDFTIIAEWQGKELSEDEVIFYMERYGRITPNNF